jgi:membrane-associated protein
MHPEHLIEAFGTLGLFAIVFAESGLLFGFFLPGDSLLFTAGLLASRGTLNFPLIMVGCAVAAIAGDQVGYVIGRRAGPALFRRPESRFFHKKNVDRAKEYFDKNGPKTIILARFIPIIRTFAPVVAGVGQMDYRKFVTFNVVGGILWGSGVTTAGYVLGESIPDIDKWLLPIIGVIVMVSFVPVFLELLKMRRKSQADRVVVAEQGEGHQ